MGVGGQKAFLGLRKIGPWGTVAQAFAQAEVDVDQALTVALHQEANLYLRALKEGIRGGAPGGVPLRPLARSTILQKRSSKPLINTGDMLRSIKIHMLNPRAIFVGIARGEQSSTSLARSGKSAASAKTLDYIGSIHEHGTGVYFQTVTKRQEVYFKRALKPIGAVSHTIKAGDVLYMRVPERPFVKPVAELLAKDAPERVSRRVMQHMGLVQMFRGGKRAKKK